uniref:PX domain-containing protein n=1 Tax=Hyaloperonospora arabidopsidis (strain Emoy2) TaxID=559515 RepID=M4BEU5_HYAAE
MGCHHSKMNDVVEGAVVPPPIESGKTSMDIVVTELLVDELSKSVPPIEEHNTIVNNEQEVAAITSPVAAPAPEEPTTKAKQPLKSKVVVQEPLEVMNESLDVNKQVATDMAPVVEEEAKEALVDSETKADDNEVVVVGVSLEEEAVVREKSIVTSARAPTVWTFVAETISFTVGVAYYNISGSNTKGDEVLLTKRYSEFKVLHAEMVKIMTTNELPRLPGASFLQGRNDQTLLQHREAAFVKMLNAIAQHSDGSMSILFTAFLA